MSLGQIYDLMRRQIVAVSVVFVLAVGMLWEVKSSPSVYSESADIVFTAPAPHSNPYSSFTSSLISTASIMTRIMLSPQSQHKVREAGGTSDFTLSLVNLYNLQFPYYGDPYVVLTATSVDPALAHRTFAVVASSFQKLIEERQADVGVPPISRIATNVVADTGPVVEVGSPKRAYAGMILLAVIGAFMVTRFLERNRVWRGTRSEPRTEVSGVGTRTR